MHPVLGQWYFNKQLWVLPTYTVFLVTAIAFGYFFALAHSKSFHIRTKEIETLFLFIIPSGFIGAKLLALNIERNDHPSIENSGLTLYGGMLFGILCVYLFSKIRKINFFSLLDVVTWSGLLGIAIGRIGCLMAGCCYGKVTALGWGILYTDPRSLAFDPVFRRHPIQLLEALCAFSLFLILFLFHNKKQNIGFFSAVSLGGYAFCRFGLEFLRGDDYRGILRYAPLSVAQLLSLVILSSSLLFIYWGKKHGSYRTYSHN